MRPALRLIQLLVQPARGMLWLLLMAEEVISYTFRHRIEVPADRYQIRVSRTERFISAILEINLLTVAAQRAVVELSQMKRTGRLIDDLSRSGRLHPYPLSCRLCRTSGGWRGTRKNRIAERASVRLRSRGTGSRRTLARHHNIRLTGACSLRGVSDSLPRSDHQMLRAGIRRRRCTLQNPSN